MRISRRLPFAIYVLLGAAVCSFAQSVALRPYISESDVAAGMREKGVSVREDQVTMPSTIPARKEHPALELMTTKPLSEETTEVLMRCADRISCVPFYAVVNGLSRDKEILKDRSKGRLATNRVYGRDSVMIKRGRTAMLEIVSSDMLITVPVVCLQNGRKGESIKLSSLDRKNTYLGEVVSAELLRSRL